MIAIRGYLHVLQERHRLAPIGARDCLTLLTTFRDLQREPLTQRLTRLSVEPQTDLTMMVFVEDERDRRFSRASG